MRVPGEKEEGVPVRPGVAGESGLGESGTAIVPALVCSGPRCPSKSSMLVMVGCRTGVEVLREREVEEVEVRRPVLCRRIAGAEVKKSFMVDGPGESAMPAGGTAKVAGVGGREGRAVSSAVLYSSRKNLTTRRTMLPMTKSALPLSLRSQSKI